MSTDPPDEQGPQKPFKVIDRRFLKVSEPKDEAPRSRYPHDGAQPPPSREDTPAPARRHLWARWVLLAPCALLAAVAARILTNLLFHLGAVVAARMGYDPPNRVVFTVLGGAAFGSVAVYVSHVMAPTYKRAVAYAASALIIAYAGVGVFAAVAFRSWYEVIEAASMGMIAGALGYSLAIRVNSPRT